MRWLRATIVVAALALVAHAADARVPAYVRQTGLVCNQCHVSWTPVMDFTFTGMKFRMNGYRTPWVAEKIEAGDEGAVNGNRLLLTLGSALSWHLRGLFLGASTPTADPSAPAPVQGASSTELIQTIGMHYCGPIGEHVGIFNEFYMYGGGLGPTTANGGAGGNRNGYIGLSHFDLVLTTNAAGNIYGFTGTLVPSPGAHDFMQLNNDPTPSNMLRNPGIIGSGAPYVYWAFYTFLADRFGLEMGVEPGEDNLDYRKFNYRIESGYFLANTDASSEKMGALGGEACYYYERTWGICQQWSTYNTWQYTDQNGVLHNIPTDASWNSVIVRRIAMNFAIYFSYGNSQSYALDQK